MLFTKTIYTCTIYTLSQFLKKYNIYLYITALMLFLKFKTNISLECHKHILQPREPIASLPSLSLLQFTFDPP